MTDFTIRGSAVVSWRNKGFQDGLRAGRSEFEAPKVEGKALQEAYRVGYRAGRRQARKG